MRGSPDRRARIAQGLFGYSANVSMVFYGTASLLRVAKTFVFVLAPRYASDFLLAPMFVALIAITAWFLVKGVDLVKWEAMATR